MDQLTPSQKGAVAEAEIAAAAVRAGVAVLRPIGEGARYDLAFDLGTHIARIQCKWASLCGGVLTARTITSRHTPRGYRRTTYRSTEVDAIALFSHDADRCYMVPIGLAEGRAEVRLRVAPTGNNQRANVRWARDYEFADALARLSTPQSTSQRPDIRAG
jgi:hypothetical protein